jgi:hypothetical protein
VILDDPHGRPTATGVGGRATLDELFRRAVMRRPDAIALIDPPNRESFTDGTPRRLTYAQADRAIWAIGARLRRMGLRRDAIVAMQLANTVESVLTLLAVLRARFIAMPLPLLWRRADAVTALGRVSASALIVSGRVGAVDHFELAMHIAAETFPIRFVCGFGANPPDGVVSFDDVFASELSQSLPASGPQVAPPSNPGAHLAAITWDVSPEGLVPVARNHGELIAGGLAVMLEAGLSQEAVLLSTLTNSSFAGLAAAILPWLLTGGTLALHHPFDVKTFAAQRQATGCDTVILPGPLVAPFAAAGLFAERHGLQRVLGIWRAPERLASAAQWNDTGISLIDVQVFGEIALIGTRRDSAGWPAPLMLGPLTAPRGAKGAAIVGEAQASDHGTVAMRGPMLPRTAFPPGAERTDLPHIKIPANGLVDTGYVGQSGPDGRAMQITTPPAGIVNVGGYRFPEREMQAIVSKVDSASTLTMLPDALAGHRLAGSAADRERVQDALARLGVNPLLIGAFRESRRSAA